MATLAAPAASPAPALPASHPASCFSAGGGAMGERLRCFDWASTPLGPISGWGPALRMAAEATMGSKFPSCLFWGPELVALYNDGYRPMLGEKPEALGQPLRVTWPEVWDDLQPIAEKALHGEATFIEDMPLRIVRHGAPETAFFTFCYSPVFDEHGQVLGMLDTVVETTSQVAAEAHARKERERQQRLLDQMPGFVSVLEGPTLVFSYVNEAYRAIAGEREFLGRTVREVFPDLEGQGFFELLDGVYRTGKAVRASAVPIQLRGEPEGRFIDMLYEPIRDDHGEITGIFVGGYDVTAQKRVEADLIASESRLLKLNAELEQRIIERSLARGKTWQLSPELIGVLNAEGRFEASNPAWVVTLGWSEEEVASTPFFDFIHPDDLPRARAAWDDAMERSQPALRLETRCRTKAGGWRWLSWVAVPEDGKIYCSARDIDEEKQREATLEQTRDALRQAQKMEAVGQLTGGLAHDFNNLLMGISGSLQLLRKRLGTHPPGELEPLVAQAMGATKRAAALTHRLLAFSRQQTLAPKQLHMGRLAQSMEELIRRTIGPEIELEVVSAVGLWGAFADPGQLESALLNLCINARDAMPHGGKIVIETANRWVDDAMARELDFAPGQYVSMCVSDNGSGMTPEVIARAFDPFFTTKPLGMGTGLGLSMVYGFARQSGGQARIYSEPGQGSMVCIYLPRSEGTESATEETAAADKVAPSQVRHTVLVVDDEPTVRRVVMTQVEELGFRVLAAANGAQALQALEADSTVSLLITDVGLPGGMNGRQVAERARTHRPQLKVLFITGYAENAALSHGHLEPGMHVMTKPFDLESLARKVRDLTDGA
jgi:PAS domain S-box-containing protein